jgi:hypothetical protein
LEVEAGGWKLAVSFTDDRRPTTDDRRPTTDDRRPTTDDRRPTTDLSTQTLVRGHGGAHTAPARGSLVRSFVKKSTLIARARL